MIVFDDADLDSTVPLQGGGAVRGDDAPDCGAAGVADDLDVG